MKTAQTWGVSAANFYTAFKEQSIKVALLNGASITGKLVGIDTYDIILSLNDTYILLPKHSILFVRPANGTHSDN